MEAKVTIFIAECQSASAAAALSLPATEQPSSECVYPRREAVACSRFVAQKMEGCSEVAETCAQWFLILEGGHVPSRHNPQFSLLGTPFLHLLWFQTGCRAVFMLLIYPESKNEDFSSSPLRMWHIQHVGINPDIKQLADDHQHKALLECLLVITVSYTVYLNKESDIVWRVVFMS